MPLQTGAVNGILPCVGSHSLLDNLGSATKNLELFHIYLYSLIACCPTATACRRCPPQQNPPPPLPSLTPHPPAIVWRMEAAYGSICIDCGARTRIQQECFSSITYIIWQSTFHVVNDSQSSKKVLVSKEYVTLKHVGKPCRHIHAGQHHSISNPHSLADSMALCCKAGSRSCGGVCLCRGVAHCS